MKTRLTLTVAALLLAAMLLINLVLLVFWKRDALQREAALDQATLIHIAYRMAAEKARPSAFFFCGILSRRTDWRNRRAAAG